MTNDHILFALCKTLPLLKIYLDLPSHYDIEVQENDYGNIFVVTVRRRVAPLPIVTHSYLFVRSRHEFIYVPESEADFAGFGGFV